MKGLFRLIGTVAAVAAGAAAVAAVAKHLEKDAVVFAEPATGRADLAEELNHAPEAVVQAAEALQADPDAAKAQFLVPDEEKVLPDAAAQADRPNPNPVEQGPAETPRTPDGKIDVTRLIDPSDFADWDDLGCKS